MSLIKNRAFSMISSNLKSSISLYSIERLFSFIAHLDFLQIFNCFPFSFSIRCQSNLYIRSFKNIFVHSNMIMRNLDWCISLLFNKRIETKSFVIDSLRNEETFSNPFYLYSNKNSSLQLTLELLIGKKIYLWSRSMKMTLISKNKLKFIDRTIHVLYKNDPL